ncbi:phage holin, LLH family [Limosilactobacillus vaginalis]|uniref:phage holin, LLH family n=1 Tax=Limosilactobacillus vaginalis TaxID=1633 RepID=UPI0025A4BFF9|nr:phage holin, LLH family [Limosilactobacillus vaginalis]MDM8222028.1 phage holin, LLH family [Limosilactobacillus vaginalis]
MKMITDIGNWLIQSGALVTVFIFAWKYIKPVMEAKKLHAKTLQERELIGLVEALADNAVNSLVSNDALTGHDKFKVATTAVNSTLADKGFNVSQATVEHAVQSAYEKSDLTPTVNPEDKPTTGVVINHD